MLQLHTIKPNPGAKHRKKRLGNGESSGLGKTCGKGNKGQKARSGGTIRPGFEGGQMPLHRRLPKKGFNNTRFQDKILIVNLSQLERVFEAGATVDENTLRASSSGRRSPGRRAERVMSSEVTGKSKEAVGVIGRYCVFPHGGAMLSNLPEGTGNLPPERGTGKPAPPAARPEAWNE